jgi:AcrR family transcriptional regulator
MTVQSTSADRLPRGPHGLTRDQVQASQRQRILDAVLDAVGERGYAATTVAHLTAAAGVSRTTFYEQFAGKEEAFLAAYDEFGEHFLADIALVSGDSPLELLSAAAARLADWGRTRPLACRAFLVEIHAVGEPGIEHRDRVMKLAEERFDNVAAWLRNVDPTLPTPPPLIGRGVVAACWELTAQAVRSPRDTTDDTREALTYMWLLGLTGRPEVGGLG